ncbi:MAG: hypothetical protein M3N42_00160, partial [Cyanobacteriota bacterium]|nr:hypothetical protein [Cyanobacteriota bacterium]
TEDFIPQISRRTEVLPTNTFIRVVRSHIISIMVILVSGRMPSLQIAWLGRLQESRTPVNLQLNLIPMYFPLN